MNRPNPSSPKRGNRMLAGLRELCAEHPGEVLTQEAIAQRCGVSRKRIEQIEQKALRKLFCKARLAGNRRFFQEYLPHNNLLRTQC